MLFLDHGFQSRPQRLVGRYAAANCQTLQAGAMQRPTRFLHEHIDHGLLKTGRQIGAALAGRRRNTSGQVLAMNGVKHGGLQAAETEIQPFVIEQRTWKPELFRISAGGFALDRGTTRKTETENARYLVERLARGVIQGGTEQFEIESTPAME